MNKVIQRVLAVLVAFVYMLAFTGCKKNIGPTMVFKPGANYTFEDNVLAKIEKTYKVGISAAPGNSDYLLGSFKLKRKYDEDSEQVLESVTITGNQRYSYERDFNITMRPKTGVEKYTFEVTDKDGKTKSLSLTFITH